MYRACYVRATALAVALSGAVSVVNAMPLMLPGLWEMRIATTFAKREQPAMTTRACLTQADIDHPTKALPLPEGDCKLHDVVTKGNRTSYDMTCKIDSIDMRGHMDIVSGTDSYDGMNDLVFNGAGVKDMRGTVVVNAKRIGDCTK
jgi:Protein of unknown function (DUF3617)